MSNSNELYKKLLLEAQDDKLKLANSNRKKLKKIYEDALEDIIKKAANARGGFTKAWLNDYKVYLKKKIYDLNNDILNLTTEAVETSSQIAAGVNGAFVEYFNDNYELNIPKELLSGAYSTNDDVILGIINGGLYKDDRSLSARIWGYGNQNLEDIQYIINKGMVEQKSYLDIIKDLEKYVDPNARRDWKFNKVYPNLGNKTVDYNAQRLLRTSVNHSFYFTNIANYKKNPYVDAVHWNLSLQHYERQVKVFGEDICDEYVRQNRYGLGTGNFPKDEVPVPHPSCMCFQTAVINKSLDEIANELSKWMNGGGNSILDNWFKEKNNNIISGKNFNNESQKQNNNHNLVINLQLLKYIADKNNINMLIKQGLVNEEAFNRFYEGFNNSFLGGIKTPLGKINNSNDRAYHIAYRHKDLMNDMGIERINETLVNPDYIKKAIDVNGNINDGYIKLFGDELLLVIGKSDIITAYYPSVNYIKNHIEGWKIIWGKK